MKSKPSTSALPPLLKQICQALEDKKADDLRVLRVSAQSSITDYLILATGTSEPHLRALRVELEKVIDLTGVRILGMDTNQGSGWIVVDAFDIMIHVFTPENREKYALERLWKDAEDIALEAVYDESKLKPAAPKAAKEPKATKKAAPKAEKAKAKPAAKKAKPAPAAKPKAAKKAPKAKPARGKK